MIWGKSHKQLRQEYNDKWQYRFNHRIPKFAWRPHQLHDGQWVWLRKIWVQYPATYSYTRYYKADWLTNTYYLTEV